MDTRNVRILAFVGVILVGIGLGLLFGWLVSPVEYVDTSPDTLREDYRTDYVLMVAEAYKTENNLDLAEQRLAFLGGTPPAEMVVAALEYAVQVGYQAQDLELLRDLVNDLRAARPTLEGP